MKVADFPTAYGFPEGMKPLFSWAPEYDEKAYDQALHLVQLPFTFHHVSIMPDTHVGYGMPIGGVLATQGAVIPNAVGVDIGCGMRAWSTNITVDEFLPRRHEIMAQIQRDIPTGFNHHKDAQEMSVLWTHEAWNEPHLEVVDREYEKAKHSLGTLGGGNHFIEAQHTAEGMVWFMIHSGSRNLGKQVADHYNKLAVKMNERWHTKVNPKWELAFLPLDSYEGQNYMAEMNACLAYAYENRGHMLAKIQEVLYNADLIPFPGLDKGIDIHHNYAAMEHWYGQNVLVHRKGAVKARGNGVIIPGSMGTESYICVGEDNPESFGSASHGAGRVWGRKEAKRNLTAQEVIEDMKGRDIELFKANPKDVAEEAWQAYKDIQVVMEHQKDLVTPITTLYPLAVVKG
jgi:tRNA-splicing ligase RtcB